VSGYERELPEDLDRNLNRGMEWDSATDELTPPPREPEPDPGPVPPRRVPTPLITPSHRGQPLTVPVGGKLSVVVGQAYDRRRRALLSDDSLMNSSGAMPRSWRALPAPIRLLFTMAVADVLVVHEHGEDKQELIMTGIGGRVSHIATPNEPNLVPLCGRRTNTEEGWQLSLPDLPLCGSCADAAVDGVLDQRPMHPRESQPLRDKGDL
jgi:hypothetical protein